MRFIYLVFSLLLIASVSQAQNVGINSATPAEKLDVNGAVRVGNTSSNNAGSIRYISSSQRFQVNIAGTWYDIATGNLAYINNFSYNATTNELTITEGSTVHTVDLDDLQDNTDDQTISYNTISNILTLEDGGTVDLTDLQDNTDDQDLTLSGNTLSIEDGNSVDLSSYVNTDDQAISYNSSSNIVTLENGGTINLSDLQDNTDDQNLTLSGNSLSIEDGNSVDLSSYVNTDDQAISYNSTTNIVTLEDGGTIDLSDLQDNTDDQAISYNPTTNVVTLEDGGTINLSDLQDNTDDQAISYNSSTNVITLEDGGTINLSDLQDNTDNQTLSEVYQEGGNNIQMNSTDGNVRFYKPSFEILTLNESSNSVGIGTQTPSALLNVYDGSSTSQPSYTTQVTNSGLLITTPYNSAVYTPGIFWSTDNNNSTKPKAAVYTQLTSSGSKLLLATSNSYSSGITNDAMVIDYNGNVGLSSATPSARLDLGDHNGDIKILDGNGTTHILGDEASGESDGIVLRTLGNPSSGEPIFVVESSGYAQRLRVEHDGAVKMDNRLEVDGSGESYIMGNTGIGTSNPSTQLHVEGSARVTGLGGSGNVLIQTDNNGNLSASSFDISATPQGTGTTNYTARWTNSTTLGTGALYDNGTNVSIGGSSPGDRLEVASGNISLSSGSGMLKVKGANGNVFELRPGQNNIDGVAIRATSNPANDHSIFTVESSGSATRFGVTQGYGAYARDGFWTGTYDTGVMTRDAGITYSGTDLLLYAGSSERIRIQSGGNVGINTTNPSYTLHVNGRLKTTGINETSDARLKKNIQPIESALEKVAEMNGVTYKWRRKTYPEMNLERGTQYGLIAQELEEIIPEVVDTDNEGWKSVEYSHLVPVLIEAIKELNATVETQKETISEMAKLQKEANNRIDKLTDRIEDMESINTLNTSITKD